MFWMRDKPEVEVVDFLLQVKDCMVREPLGYTIIIHSRDLPTLVDGGRC